VLAKEANAYLVFRVYYFAALKLEQMRAYTTVNTPRARQAPLCNVMRADIEVASVAAGWKRETRAASK